MFDLTGKSALVTGASGGIGGAIARALHASGAAVALSGTRTEPLKALRESLGDRAHVTPADLGAPDGATQLAKDAEAALGQIDILVNNAGLTRDGLAMRMKEEDWNKVLEVNLTASFRLGQAMLRGMMKRRWGRIIAITSIVGVTGNGGQTNYAASKAGLIGMSKSLAQEVASRGITVNCIAPGFIKTETVQPIIDLMESPQSPYTYTRTTPLGPGTPRDVGDLAVFLASDEGRFFTGSTLAPDGGLLAY